MRNYWLSECIEEKDSTMPPPEDDDSEDSDPKDKLTPRQQSLYDYYESVVEEFGSFDKGTKGNGAHYAPAKANPFQKEGLICGNCVFFENGACEIVQGSIESNGICKLWIIPEDLIKTPK